MENELKETEKGIANLIKDIEKGVISDAVTSRLEKLEKDKANLKEAMEAENKNTRWQRTRTASRNISICMQKPTLMMRTPETKFWTTS